MECCAKHKNKLVHLVRTMNRNRGRGMINSAVEFPWVPACSLDFNDAVASGGLSTTGRTQRGG